MTLKKAIAVIAVFFFGATYILNDAWAAVGGMGEPFSFDERGIKDIDVETFTIPPHMGIIKYHHKGDPNKVLVHIQDAHCNYTAQKKIFDIIEYLNKEYGIRMVNLEGGAGQYDLTDFTGILDENIRSKVADYFLKWGRINGSELFAIEKPGVIDLWGVEDTDLYIKNLDVYTDSLSYKAEVKKYIEQIDHVLERLKSKIYSPELYEIDLKYAEYKANKVEFKDYLSFLMEKSRLKGINIKSYPNIYLLSQSMEQEGRIDFKQANLERDALIDNMQKVLSKNQLEELVRTTISFRNRDISQNVFYEYLIKTAKEANQDLDDYPQLREYIVYVSLYDAVDKTAVMAEIEDLEKEIKETLYRNEEERKLNELSKNLVLTKNMFDIAFTREDYRYYLKNKASFDVRNYVSFIREEAPKYHINADLDPDVNRLDEFRRRIFDFYDYSFKRDKVFIENMKFSGEDIKTGILVTGGFHTDNMCELLKENDISYISIIPSFKIDKGYECPYFEILSGGVSPVEESISSSVALIQVADFLSPLGEDVYGKEKREVFRMAKLVIQERFASDNDLAVELDDGRFMVIGLVDGSPTFNISTEKGDAENIAPGEKFELNAVGITAAFSEIAQDRKIAAAEEKDRRRLDEESEPIIAARGILEMMPEERRGTLNGALNALLLRQDVGGVQLIDGLVAAHAGGQGIYIPMAVDQTEVPYVLVHELIAGVYAGNGTLSSHQLAEQVVSALKQKNTSRVAELLEKASMHVSLLDESPKTIWQMSLAERRQLRTRDYAEEADLDLPKDFADLRRTKSYLDARLERYPVTETRRTLLGMIFVPIYNLTRQFLRNLLASLNIDRDDANRIAGFIVIGVPLFAPIVMFFYLIKRVLAENPEGAARIAEAAPDAVRALNFFQNPVVLGTLIALAAAFTAYKMFVAVKGMMSPLRQARNEVKKEVRQLRKSAAAYFGDEIADLFYGPLDDQVTARTFWPYVEKNRQENDTQRERADRVFAMISQRGSTAEKGQKRPMSAEFFAEQLMPLKDALRGQEDTEFYKRLMRKMESYSVLAYELADGDGTVSAKRLKEIEGIVDRIDGNYAEGKADVKRGIPYNGLLDQRTGGLLRLIKVLNTVYEDKEKLFKEVNALLEIIRGKKINESPLGSSFVQSYLRSVAAFLGSRVRAGMEDPTERRAYIEILENFPITRLNDPGSNSFMYDSRTMKSLKEGEFRGQTAGFVRDFPVAVTGNSQDYKLAGLEMESYKLEIAELGTGQQKRQVIELKAKPGAYLGDTLLAEQRVFISLSDRLFGRSQRIRETGYSDSAVGKNEAEFVFGDILGDTLQADAGDGRGAQLLTIVSARSLEEDDVQAAVESAIKALEMAQGKPVAEEEKLDEAGIDFTRITPAEAEVSQKALSALADYLLFNVYSQSEDRRRYTPDAVRDLLERTIIPYLLRAEADDEVRSRFAGPRYQSLVEPVFLNILKDEGKRTLLVNALMLHFEVNNMASLVDGVARDEQGRLTRLDAGLRDTAVTGLLARAAGVGTIGKWQNDDELAAFLADAEDPGKNREAIQRYPGSLEVVKSRTVSASKRIADLTAPALQLTDAQRAVRDRTLGRIDAVLEEYRKSGLDVDRVRNALALPKGAEDAEWSREKAIDGSVVFQALRNPTLAFKFFLSKVYGRETYFLGYDGGLALDVVDFLFNTGSMGLIDEYIIHEALEKMDIFKGNEQLKHRFIVELTSAIFDFDFTSPGATPLGRQLRKFIDRKAVAAELEVREDILFPEPVDRAYADMRAENGRFAARWLLYLRSPWGQARGLNYLGEREAALTTTSFFSIVIFGIVAAILEPLGAPPGMIASIGLMGSMVTVPVALNMRDLAQAIPMAAMVLEPLIAPLRILIGGLVDFIKNRIVLGRRVARVINAPLSKSDTVQVSRAKQAFDIIRQRSLSGRNRDLLRLDVLRVKLGRLENYMKRLKGTAFYEGAVGRLGNYIMLMEILSGGQDRYNVTEKQKELVGDIVESIQKWTAKGIHLGWTLNAERGFRRLIEALIRDKGADQALERVNEFLDVLYRQAEMQDLLTDESLPTVVRFIDNIAAIAETPAIGNIFPDDPELRKLNNLEGFVRQNLAGDNFIISREGMVLLDEGSGLLRPIVQNTNIFDDMHIAVTGAPRLSEDDLLSLSTSEYRLEKEIPALGGRVRYRLRGRRGSLMGIYLTKNPIYFTFARTIELRGVESRSTFERGPSTKVEAYVGDLLSDKTGRSKVIVLASRMRELPEGAAQEYFSAMVRALEDTVERPEGVDIFERMTEEERKELEYRRTRPDEIPEILKELSLVEGQVRGNIAKGLNNYEEDAARERVKARKDEVSNSESGRKAVELVKKRCRRFVRRNEKKIRRVLESYKFPKEQIDQVIDALSDPEASFMWFLAREHIEHTEKYLLGFESALAVDVVEWLDRKGDLLEEYILHEALERTGMYHNNPQKKHRMNIEITSRVFNRKKVIKGIEEKALLVPGTTPLGVELRNFIDSAAEAKTTERISTFKNYFRQFPNILSRIKDFEGAVTEPLKDAKKMDSGEFEWKAESLIGNLSYSNRVVNYIRGLQDVFNQNVGRMLGQKAALSAYNEVMRLWAELYLYELERSYLRGAENNMTVLTGSATEAIKILQENYLQNDRFGAESTIEDYFRLMKLLDVIIMELMRERAKTGEVPADARNVLIAASYFTGIFDPFSETGSDWLGVVRGYIQDAELRDAIFNNPVLASFDIKQKMTAIRWLLTEKSLRDAAVRDPVFAENYLRHIAALGTPGVVVSEIAKGKERSLMNLNVESFRNQYVERGQKKISPIPMVEDFRMPFAGIAGNIIELDDGTVRIRDNGALEFVETDKKGRVTGVVKDSGIGDKKVYALVNYGEAEASAGESGAGGSVFRNIEGRPLRDYEKLLTLPGDPGTMQDALLVKASDNGSYYIVLSNTGLTSPDAAARTLQHFLGLIRKDAAEMEVNVRRSEEERQAQQERLLMEEARGSLMGKLFGDDGQLLTGDLVVTDEPGSDFITIGHSGLTAPVTVRKTPAEDLPAGMDKVKDKIGDILDSKISGEAVETLDDTQMSILKDLRGRLEGVKNIVVLEPHENIRGYFGPGTLYLSRDFFDETTGVNYLAIMHELGESAAEEALSGLKEEYADIAGIQALTMHTFMRGAGKDVRMALDTLIRAEGREYVERISEPETMISELQRVLRAAGRREMTGSEMALIRYNFARDTGGITARSNLRVRSRLFGFQDNLDPDYNMALNLQNRALRDNMVRGGVNIHLIRNANIDTMGGQAKFGQDWRRTAQDQGFKGRVMGFTDKQSLMAELAEAVLFAEDMNRRDPASTSKISVACQKQEDIDTVNEFLALPENQRYRDWIVIVNDRVEDESEVQDMTLAMMKLISAGDILCNLKREKIDYGKSPEELQDSMRDAMLFFRSWGCFDSYDGDVVFEAMSAEDLDSFMEKLFAGQIIMRITRIDYEEITDWNKAQQEVLRSL